MSRKCIDKEKLVYCSSAEFELTTQIFTIRIFLYIGYNDAIADIEPPLPPPEPAVAGIVPTDEPPLPWRANAPGVVPENGLVPLSYMLR
jgi:hypothetical protein